MSTCTDFATTIFIGDRFAGHVVECLAGLHEAAPPSGPSLGLFASWSAAQHALVQAAQWQQNGE